MAEVFLETSRNIRWQQGLPGCRSLALKLLCCPGADNGTAILGEPSG
jgi:hypothetical protein